MEINQLFIAWVNIMGKCSGSLIESFLEKYEKDAWKSKFLNDYNLLLFKCIVDRLLEVI
jgi:hypothetical protein